MEFYSASQVKEVNALFLVKVPRKVLKISNSNRFNAVVFNFIGEWTFFRKGHLAKQSCRILRAE